MTKKRKGRGKSPFPSVRRPLTKESPCFSNCSKGNCLRASRWEEGWIRRKEGSFEKNRENARGRKTKVITATQKICRLRKEARVDLEGGSHGTRGMITSLSLYYGGEMVDTAVGSPRIPAGNREGLNQKKKKGRNTWTAFQKGKKQQH